MPCSDRLRGGSGDDRLFGEAEEQGKTGDILTGGAGSDHLDGSGYYADIIRYTTSRANPPNVAHQMNSEK